MWATMDESFEKPENRLDVVRTDKSGDVDVALVEHCLSLTPAQRLARLEQFIEFVTEARRRNGIDE